MQLSAIARDALRRWNTRLETGKLTGSTWDTDIEFWPAALSTPRLVGAWSPASDVCFVRFARRLVRLCRWRCGPSKRLTAWDITFFPQDVVPGASCLALRYVETQRAAMNRTRVSAAWLGPVEIAPLAPKTAVGRPARHAGATLTEWLAVCRRTWPPRAEFSALDGEWDTLVRELAVSLGLPCEPRR